MHPLQSVSARAGLRDFRPAAFAAFELRRVPIGDRWYLTHTCPTFELILRSSP